MPLSPPVNQPVTHLSMSPSRHIYLYPLFRDEVKEFVKGWKPNKWQRWIQSHVYLILNPDFCSLKWQQILGWS